MYCEFSSSRRDRNPQDFAVLLSYPAPAALWNSGVEFTALVGAQDNVLYDIISPWPSVGSEGSIINGGGLFGTGGGGVSYESQTEVNSTIFTVDCGSLSHATQVANTSTAPIPASLSDIISSVAATYVFDLGVGSNFTVAVNPIRE